MASTGNPYRRILKEVADNLTFSDVGSIKFVCRGLIGAGALDKIPNREPLTLFRLLEERQIISEGNLKWLRDILKQIQRIDLVLKIPVEFCQSDFVDSGAMVAAGSISSGMFSSSPTRGAGVSPYRMLLKQVADELTNENVSEMKFLLDVPDGISEKLPDGQALMTHMEGSGKLSEDNFTELTGLLGDIYRKDLIKKIEKFTIGQPAPQPRLPFARDPASCYTMRRPYGFALIINNHKFEGSTAEGSLLKERRGSDIDVGSLEDLWRQLGFVVQKHVNLKAHQICSVVTDIANKINKNRDSSCFVCCIMTHGTMGKIYGSDSEHIDIKDITNLFKEANCPGLAGKPKLFFIQACRGRKEIAGRLDNPTPNSEPPIPDLANNPKSNTQQTDAQPVAGDDKDDEANDTAFRHNADPNEPHFLLGYSTAPGYVSFRSIDHGTWYVNALKQVFSQYHPTEDVLQMLTRVNCLVTNAYTSKGYQQCPVPVFTLAKSVYF